MAKASGTVKFVRFMLVGLFGLLVISMVCGDPYPVEQSAPVAEKPAPVAPVEVSKDNPNIPDCVDLAIYIKKVHPEHGFFDRAIIVDDAEKTGKCETKHDKD